LTETWIHRVIAGFESKPAPSMDETDDHVATFLLGLVKDVLWDEGAGHSEAGPQSPAPSPALFRKGN
jgi:hypothetical protein